MVQIGSSLIVTGIVLVFRNVTLNIRSYTEIGSTEVAVSKDSIKRGT